MRRPPRPRTGADEPVHIAVSGPIVALLALLAAGCLGRSPVVHHYTMSPVAGAQAARSDLVVGLGPVTVAEYLDRPQLVTREDGARIHIDDAHRWAGGFESNLREALADDLRARLGTELLFRDVSLAPAPVAFQVAVDVRRFEGSRDGDVVLRARWLVREAAGEGRVVSRLSTIRQEASGGAIEDLVAAYDVALGRLADEIAAQVQRLR